MEKSNLIKNLVKIEFNKKLRSMGGKNAEFMGHKKHNKQSYGIIRWQIHIL